jgi:hypothetical protein
MSRNSTLDTLSGKLFFSAILINRAGKFSIPLIAHLCFVLSTVLYLCGYVFWRTAVYEDESRRHQFAQQQKNRFDHEFRHNRYYQLTAFTGIIACVLALFSLTNPLLAVISAWAFFVSNAFWYQAETITLNRLKEDKPLSPEYKAQSLYYKYTRLSTAISLINPILFTLVLAVPAVGIPLTSVATLYLIGLNLIAISNWVKSGRAFSRIPDKSTALSQIEVEAEQTRTVPLSHSTMIRKMPPDKTMDALPAPVAKTDTELSYKGRLLLDHNDFISNDSCVTP